MKPILSQSLRNLVNRKAVKQDSLASSLALIAEWGAHWKIYMSQLHVFSCRARWDEKLFSSHSRRDKRQEKTLDGHSTGKMENTTSPRISN
ncbi:hypothetical protein CEXT_75561 [Caerostris extrusa]|uniref:Uncharacterized protein n=1 Tax=Caerostris extrusa TaxID=172846 RepID=A0AAV4XUM5_CAEEX|nr:hypothetical protein CEXT_75561 [Caerostris extrusa]